MKTLYLIRHAKSSWKNLDLDDFERPLNKRGKNDAPMMGERFKKRKIIPDIIFSSSAKRAKMTAKSIAEKIQYDKEIVCDKNIYEADENTLQSIVNTLDDSYKVVFLIGHNPGLNELAQYYVGFDDNLPTCGVIGVTFTCKHWQDAKSDNARLSLVDYPKKL
ncbi:SixA phosphatase family protein [Sulfurimonas sp.]